MSKPPENKVIEPHISNEDKIDTISTISSDQSRSMYDKLMCFNKKDKKETKKEKEPSKYNNNILNTIHEEFDEEFDKDFNDDNYFLEIGYDDRAEIRFNPESLKDANEDSLSLENRTKLLNIRGFTEIKNLMNNTFGYKEGQLSSTLDIVGIYMRGQKILYLEAKSYCEYYLWRLMIPTIIISTLCTIVSGVLNTFPYTNLGIAVASGINTILIAIANYFKLDARSEAHRMTAYSFDQLISECEFTSGKILMCNDLQREDTNTNINNNDDDKSEKSDKPEKYDLKYIQAKIDENREKSLLVRDKIREYAERNFGWNIFIEKYINNIRN